MTQADQPSSDTCTWKPFCPNDAEWFGGHNPGVDDGESWCDYHMGYKDGLRRQWEQPSSEVAGLDLVEGERLLAERNKAITEYEQRLQRFYKSGGPDPWDDRVRAVAAWVAWRDANAEALIAALRQAQAENVRVVGELQKSQARNRGLRDDLSQAQAQVEQLQRTSLALGHDIEKRDEVIAGNGYVIGEQESQLTQLRAELATVKAERDQWRTERYERDRELSDLLNTLRDEREELAGLEAQVRELEDELDSMNSASRWEPL